MQSTPHHILRQAFTPGPPTPHDHSYKQTNKHKYKQKQREHWARSHSQQARAQGTLQLPTTFYAGFTPRSWRKSGRKSGVNVQSTPHHILRQVFTPGPPTPHNHSYKQTKHKHKQKHMTKRQINPSHFTPASTRHPPTPHHILLQLFTPRSWRKSGRKSGRKSCRKCAVNSPPYFTSGVYARSSNSPQSSKQTNKHKYKQKHIIKRQTNPSHFTPAFTRHPPTPHHILR